MQGSFAAVTTTQPQMSNGVAMSLKEMIKSLVPQFILDARRARIRGIGEFTFNEDFDVKDDIRHKYGYDGYLLHLFADNKKYVVHKWHHYIPIYDRYFSSFRGRKVRFLEIGVSKGGSLQMWRAYFGKDAIIFGIDIDDEVMKLVYVTTILFLAGTTMGADSMEECGLKWLREFICYLRMLT